MGVTLLVSKVLGVYLLAHNKKLSLYKDIMTFLDNWKYLDNWCPYEQQMNIKWTWTIFAHSLAKLENNASPKFI
jgi:hypothetical protein